MSSNEPSSMARRFLSLCLAVLVGVVLLYLAIWLLSQFWGWLVLLAAVAALSWLAVVVYRWRRNRW